MRVLCSDACWTDRRRQVGSRVESSAGNSGSATTDDVPKWIQHANRVFDLAEEEITGSCRPNTLSSAAIPYPSNLAQRPPPPCFSFSLGVASESDEFGRRQARCGVSIRSTPGGLA